MFEGFKNIFKSPEQAIGDKKEENKEQDKGGGMKMKSPAGGEGLKKQREWEEASKKDPNAFREQV